MLEVVIRCQACGEEVDQWDLADEPGADLATQVCEIAGDLKLYHDCPKGASIGTDADDDKDDDEDEDEEA